MQLYGRGLRRRVPSMLGGDQRWIRMAYSLMFALPGAPTLFYGEEIGMAENLDVEDRLAVRTPMQWTGDAAAGFSSAPPDGLVRPLPGRRAVRPTSGQRPRSAHRSGLPPQLVRAPDPLAQGGAGDRLGHVHGAPDRGRRSSPSVTTGGSHDCSRCTTSAGGGGESSWICRRRESGELRDLLRRDEPVPVLDGRATLTLAAHDHRWLRLDTTL